MPGFPFALSVAAQRRSRRALIVAFSLYILECADGTLYIGHTDNLDERMRQHEMGKADAYTARRHPLKLLHVEEFETRYEALMMERKLKGWTRAKKLAYIAGDWNRNWHPGKGKASAPTRLAGASTSRPPAATLSANGISIPSFVVPGTRW